MPNEIKKAFELIKNPSAYTLAEHNKAHNLFNEYSGSQEFRALDPDEEFLQAKRHFNESGDVRFLSVLLISANELTKDARFFIAGVLAGLIKPKNKKKPEYLRDEMIYIHIKLLLEQGENLTTTRKDTGGAALQVSERFGITEDAALKIYERKQPKPK